MAAGGREASILGLNWQDIGRMRRNAEASITRIKGLENALVYWTGKGGALNRKAALDAATYIKTAYLTQEDITNFAPIDPDWRHAKISMGLNPGVGLATGSLAKAIDAQEMGGGKWRVGISKNERAWNFIGHSRTRKGTLRSTTRNISEYANYLEFGTRYQVPRPMFAYYFTKWVEYRSIEVLRPFASILSKELNLLANIWKSGGVYSEDDICRNLARTARPGEEIDESTDVFETVAANLMGTDEDRRVYDPPTETTTASADIPSVIRRTGGKAGKEGLFDADIIAMGYNIKIEGDKKFIKGNRYMWDEIKQYWMKASEYHAWYGGL